ncbi:imidazolonepropionase [Marinicella sp. S1101]|uniref:imidazolonepropionase n=1 Tax=Marinicella marina TaxID=2996016 RepID=UPI002260C631|nr:imidazolonepropionase [Marinicella marina]MCX7552289.1 imidazolonepropionase [Marinicella marina]MDJ1139165.1 imidazolonepropionase [Marinicella marina]
MKKNCDLLIHNAQVITCAENGQPYGLLENGVVACAGGKIIAVEAAGSSDDFTAAQCIDAKGQVLTPALIDCHTHLVFAGSRAGEFAQRLAGVSYEEIARSGGGILSTVKATRKASMDALVSSACERLAHLKSQGVMTVEIKSGYGLDFDNEIKMLQAAKRAAEKMQMTVQTTLLAAHAVPTEYQDDRAAYLKMICQELIPYVAKEQLADAVDAFCEGIGFSPEETRLVFDAAARWGLPVKLHADQLSDLGGAGMVAEYGGLSADHVEYTSIDSIKKMATSDTVATLLPYAFYALSETQLPPIAAFRKHGVGMAIATDCNPGTAPTTNLLQCLHMACTQFGLTVEEAILAVTINAAKALGLDHNKGSIEVGKDAELVLWNTTEVADLVYWQGQRQAQHYP